MKDEHKTPEQEEANAISVLVNTDPQAGPLDGASAPVYIAKTRFAADKSKGTAFKQRRVKGKLKASYLLGTVSISIPGERIMLTARIDEMMQVMFASAEAYKANYQKKDEEKKEGEDD